MIAEAARRLDESVAKKQYSVEHWIHDVNYQRHWSCCNRGLR